MDIAHNKACDGHKKRGTIWYRRCSKRCLLVLLSSLCLIGQLIYANKRLLVFGVKAIPRPVLQTEHHRSHHTSANLTTVGSGSSQHTSANLTTVGTGQFFIYTVVAEQSYTTFKWNSLIFNGWEERLAASVDYRCCMKYRNGHVTSTVTSEKRLVLNKGQLRATQIVCNINNTNPVFSGLVLANQRCQSDTVYLRPVYRQRELEPKFAICGKIAYGGKSAQELVEWMEYHLHYGASAVVIYPYEDLNDKAYKVLNYYVSQGHLEIVPLPRVPRLDKYKRQFHQIGHVKDQDEQVPNFDAQERLLAYKYYTIIDTDEFIAPKHDNITNFVQLMELLLTKHKDAGSFRLLTEAHLLNWEQTNSSSDLKIARYGYHTEPVALTQKLLHVTDRIEPGTVWIHNATLKNGFKRVVPDASDVVLKHYRSCKQWWFRAHKKKKPCLDHFQKIRGHFMEGVASKIRANVANVKRVLDID